MPNRLITPPDVLLKALLKTPFRPQPLSIDGKEIPYMRLEIPIEIDDLFAFMEAQTLYPKVYFENPQDGICAGLGAALMLDHLPLFGEKEGPRFYGGTDFMERRRTTWEDYPETAYFLPLIEIEKKSSGMILVLNRVEEKIDASLEMERSIQHDVNVISRLDSPSYPVWEREVKEVLQGIRREDFLKVVLARCTRFEFDETLKPFALLKELEGENRLVFQFSKGQAFLSLTPETLYRRKKNLVEGAAVAGTRPRGKTEEEDQSLMEDLLKSPKDQHEFQLVSQMIQKALQPLCSILEVHDEKVLKTPKVQHLFHTFRGKLMKKTDDKALIQALHPTPAVGGMPRLHALDEIRKRERFDRGWYAAPIGWVSPQEGHHLVGIRSALIEENTLRLFAGTGIVLGSIPSKEWDELEQKIQQYVSVL